MGAALFVKDHAKQRSYEAWDEQQIQKIHCDSFLRFSL
jgi:hypothetical protein